MNLRSEVHSAITTQFSTAKTSVEKIQKKSHSGGPEYYRPSLLKRWDPYCDYVRLYPKEFTVARLLMRYGASSVRVKIENFNLQFSILDDNFLIREMWRVSVVDCATSIVLAWVVGIQPSQLDKTSSEPGRISENPQFLFNHFDDADSRVLQIIRKVAHCQLKKTTFQNRQPPFLDQPNCSQNLPQRICKWH